eukprot:s5961_g2.t1
MFDRVARGCWPVACIRFAVTIAKVQLSIERFPKEQNAKTQKVVLSLIENRRRGLQALAFVGWSAWSAKSRQEKRLESKFSSEADGLDGKLFNCKASQLTTVRSDQSEGCRRAGHYSDGRVCCVEEVCLHGGRIPRSRCKAQGRPREALQCEGSKVSVLMFQPMKENAKKSMVRMTAGEDEAMMALVLGAWINWLAEKTDNAREMLQRMQGATESGLVHSVFTAWSEDFKAGARTRAVEATINSQQEQIKALSTRQKATAKSFGKRNGYMQEDILTMQIFMNWYTEVRTEHVRRHYMGKMDTKEGITASLEFIPALQIGEQKFEAVQTMIKSFANQLEQGIGNSPPRVSESERPSARRYFLFCWIVVVGGQSQIRQIGRGLRSLRLSGTHSCNNSRPDLIITSPWQRRQHDHHRIITEIAATVLSSFRYHAFNQRLRPNMHTTIACVSAAAYAVSAHKGEVHPQISP